MDLNYISVTILTKNSEKYLSECLEALVDFGEIIILDNGSEDKTLEIASRFSNVKIFKDKFIGFGPLKNKAASYAKHDWIFNIDSDEIVTEDLIDEIRNLKADINEVYTVKRLNYYGKKLIKCCGWYPDRVIRIYNKIATKYYDYQVHESVMLNNVKLVNLKSNIKHYSIEKVEQLIDKMQRYSTLFAGGNKGLKKSSPVKAFSRAIFSFIKNYFFRKGIFYGHHGFLISFWIASTVYFKYIKLYEENESNDICKG